MVTTGLFSSQRNRSWLLVAALVFLLVQTITLQHTHDGDLSLHPDCSICLKVGSQGDLAIGKTSLPEITLFFPRHQVAFASLISRAVPSPQSRAPPQTA